MSKYLRALIQECRELLEKEFSSQREEGFSCSVEELALASLLELAIIRCFEEQRWCIPTRLSPALDEDQILRNLILSRQQLLDELPFSLPFLNVSKPFLSYSSLKTILHHFLLSIPPDEWRSEHILGWIYQYFYANTSEQKQHGQFYTPTPIADYIVKQILDMAQLDKLDVVSSSFTILDLACGCGAFALRAFERVYAWYISWFALRQAQSERHPVRPGPIEGRMLNDIPQHILANHLFLVDNDPWACQIATINLYLKAKRVEPSCRIKTMNIFCGDALRRKVKNLFTRKYDCVVGNPPYIVVNQLHAPKELIDLYKSYASAAFKINTFPLFIERGIGLLKPDGILGMIVPNTLFTQVYFEPLRKYILKTSKILRILDTKRMFDNAFVENCILLLQRESEASERSQNLVDCVTYSSNSGNSYRVNDADVIARSTATKQSRRDCFATLAMTPSFPSGQAISRISQYHFEHAPFNIFPVHIDEQIFALIEKIARGNPKFGELCESHDGVNPGNAKHKLIVSEKLDDSCKEILNGKNIGRYWLKWGGLYVRYNRSLLTKGDNVRWGHQRSLDAAKILTRQTADRLIGTYESGEYYATNSIHTTILREGIREFHLKYLLGLLNSKLISFYYRKLLPEDGQLFSQVKLVNLRQLPMKQASDEEQQQVIGYVDALLQANKLLHTPAEREKMEREIQEIDDILDRKVYALYQLSPDEIDLVEQEMGSAT
jgi:adenine-specific DNA-methyltransferase